LSAPIASRVPNATISQKPPPRQPQHYGNRAPDEHPPEPEFWEALDEISYVEKVDRNELIRRLESAAPETRRTSAVRVFVLQHIRNRCLALEISDQPLD